MTPDPSASMAPVRGLLDGVRAHLRRSRIARGAAIVVAALGAAFLVSFALDVVLDLPAAVRAVHLVVVVVVLVAVARWAFAPLRLEPSDDALAAAVEHDVPEFQDRLASSLDFERRIADPAEPESRAMMAAAVRDASDIAQRIDPSLLVDRRPARRAMLLATTAVVAVAAVRIAFPEQSSIWAERGLGLSATPYPRRTSMRVEGFPAEGPLVVTRGDDLRVVAIAEGAFPPDADLHISELSDAPDGAEPEVTFRDVRKMLPVEGQPGRYAFDFRAVPSSFQFHVTGGDDTDEVPVYEVRALIPPRVASFEVAVEPPAYSGVAASVVRDPSFEALAGSRLAFRFKSNVPLASARRTPVPRPGSPAAAPEDLVLAPGGLEFAWETVLDATVEFHLDLRAAAGQTNRGEDDVFRVDAVTDRAPAITLLHPRSRASVTPNGVLPVKAVADDDFGLAEVSMELSRGTTARWAPVLWKPGESAAPAAPAAPSAPAATPAIEKRVHVFRAADLAALAGDPSVPTKPGDDLSLRIRARDTGGHDAQSQDVVVEVVAADELSRRLAAEMARLREDLTQTRRGLRRSIGALRELRDSLGAAAADPAALRRARDVLVDEGRATNDTARFVTGTVRVIDAHVLNRLGSVPTVDRLMPLYLDHLARPPGDTGDVFPPALYAAILEEKRAKRLYDPEMLGILLDVADLATRARDEMGPAAYDALDRWTADDSPRTAAALGDPLQRAADLLATLDAVDERLQRFEDMEQIIRLAKAIHDVEEGLTRPASAPGERK